MSGNIGIVDVLTESVKTENTFSVFFGTGDFSTVDTAFAHGLAAKGTGSHDSLNSLLLDNTAGTSVFDLLGDILSDKHGIEIRILDFDDGNLKSFRILLESFDKIGLIGLEISTILT